MEQKAVLGGFYIRDAERQPRCRTGRHGGNEGQGRGQRQVLQGRDARAEVRRSEMLEGQAGAAEVPRSLYCWRREVWSAGPLRRVGIGGIVTQRQGNYDTVRREL